MAICFGSLRKLTQCYSLDNERNTPRSLLIADTIPILAWMPQSEFPECLAAVSELSVSCRHSFISHSLSFNIFSCLLKRQHREVEQTPDLKYNLDSATGQSFHLTGSYFFMCKVKTWAEWSQQLVITGSPYHGRKLIIPENFSVLSKLDS